MLFRDRAGRVLLVDPNYREGERKWILPGGTVESGQGETPRQGARREAAEEIGLDVEPGALIAVDWVTRADRPPLAVYLYDGGVLDEEQLGAIQLQKEELDAWNLVPLDQVGTFTSPEMAGRIRAGFSALMAGTGPAELENGHRVGPAPAVDHTRRTGSTPSGNGTGRTGQRPTA
ncbi:NUDIX domain-containing protein [Streptomyces sp. H39-S7]|uniref:NUDIX domain-containing protein n=1 Tax=Streptomyces sp. H39-S7 TaxID=3004357 RepID=UPI0022AFE20B|nr:NUDIX hydrolase [Streptomyces sp. H39-S7]MCZ4123757.1 NUDIX hydrolase [Streptomyces sp. H39-S7]